jgi:hypothetical protein
MSRQKRLSLKLDSPFRNYASTLALFVHWGFYVVIGERREEESKNRVLYLAPRCPPSIFTPNSMPILVTSFGSMSAPGPTRIHSS